MKYKTRQIWTPGEPQLFTNECFIFNRKDIFNPSKSTENITGVYLPIDSSKDYRGQTMTLFGHRNYAYDPNQPKVQPMKGISTTFITAATTVPQTNKITAYCIKSDYLNRKAVFNLALTPASRFCYRNEDISEDLDDQLFYQNVRFSEYEHGPCNNSNETVLPLKDESEEPDDTQPPRMGDFRTIDPENWKAFGSKGVAFKPGNPGYPAPAKRETGENHLSRFNEPFPPGFYFPQEIFEEPTFYSESEESKRGKRGPPMEIYATEIDECEEIPAPPSTTDCKEKIDTDTACSLLNHVLTIEKGDWKDPSLRKSAWRIPVWRAIENIFAKICPQVAGIMAPAVGRIIEFYFSKLLDDPDRKIALQLNRNPIWKDLQIELNRCLVSAKPMQFRRVRNIGAEKKRSDIMSRLMNGRGNNSVYVKEVKKCKSCL